MSRHSLILRLAQVLLVAIVWSTGSASAMTEKATGVNFAAKWKDLDLFGVGVRKKAVINAYAVAMYCQSSVKEKLSEFSRSKQKKEALECLRQSVAASGDTAFAIEMTFKVGAEKIASALADSVATRYKGSSSDVDDFKGLVLNGLQGKPAATKGTKFEFHCRASGLNVAVDGKDQGQVSSPGLSKAFCNVYLDDKCVSPALRESILQHCCAP